VNELTEIDTFTDLVSVLFVASADTEHGRVSHDLVVDPLFLSGDVESARGDDEADTIGREDPAGHTRLLGDHEAFRLDDVRSDDSLVVSDGSADARMFLGGDPGVVDLLVLESKALPRGVGVERGTDVDDEALLAELLDGLEALDVGEASVGSLAESHTTVKAEGELLGDSAIAGSVDLGPGSGASAVAEEWVVKEANALLVAIGGLGDDEGGGLKRVAAFPRHGTVARLADDFNLDLHTTTLATVDAESSDAAVTSAFGVDNCIREELRRNVLALENVTADVHGCTTIVVLLSDGAVGADDAALEGAEGLKLEHDLGGDDLGDHTSELISRTTTKDQVFPLFARRKEAKFLAHLLLINFGGIGKTVVAVNTFTNAFVPGRTKRIHSISVTIKIENLLLGIRNSIFTILHNPNKIAHGIKIYILRTFNRSDFNDTFLQIL
jgi:hypothetical protein